MGNLNIEEYLHWEEIITSLLPKSKALHILNVRSGSDFLTVILSGMGHSAVSIDIAGFDKLNFGNGSFDAVICLKTLAAPHEQKSVWAEIKRVLKDDGRIIIFDTGEITQGQLQAQGFSHCRVKDINSLTSETLRCLSAYKPSRDENDSLPQIALFKKHLQIAKKQIQLYQSRCQSIGMPYPEYTVLNMISRHSKGVRPSDISSSLVIPPQTLTRILAGLQSGGYIDRKTSDTDQRSSVITITDAGTERIKPLQAALQEIEEKAFSGYDADELAGFIGLSDKLLGSLESAIHSTVFPYHFPPNRR